jgi:hypothetical protein
LPLLHQDADIPAQWIRALLQGHSHVLLVRGGTVLTQFPLAF